MSKALGTIGKVAGVVATVAAFIPGAQPIAAAAAAAATLANIGSELTRKKPRAQGSATSIQIGASMPSPYIMGQSYYGGNRVLQVGYGTADGVPNAYAAAADIYSVGGPLNSLVAIYADFAPLTFAAGNAVGFYANYLYEDHQLGETPESDALTPHWAGPPDWGASYRLSGKAAILYNARFPKDGKKFGSGLPQFGAEWEGVLYYDPRLDGTYPGGSGAHRWAVPTDVAAFSAAKNTWEYGRNPALHALRYALGVWERDEANAGADYMLTFGMGLPYDGVVIEDFVELANVCDANDWNCDGVIFEPGDRWSNLKSICEAGGAAPCIKGGRLGLRVVAPKVSLDTITRDDLADGGLSVPATTSYRDRLNTIIPKYRSPDHKWEYVTTDPVQVAEFVTLDGEERIEERQFNLVKSAGQATQLAGYDLMNGRERFPIELTCKPRMRLYSPGDQLTVDLPEAGLVEQACVIVRRSVDPATMMVTFTLIEETAAKHEYALGLTGSAPPDITIEGAEDRDDVAGDIIYPQAGPLASLAARLDAYGIP